MPWKTSRRIYDPNSTAELADDVLCMAIARRVQGGLRAPRQPVRATAAGKDNARHGIRPFMGFTSSSWGNVPTESLMDRLSPSASTRGVFDSREQTTFETFDYIERFYNRCRLTWFRADSVPAGSR